jgi:hypothetical protein
MWMRHLCHTALSLRKPATLPRSRDEEDLLKLADLVGITTVDQALRLCERFFPTEPLPPRSAAMLEDLFNSR